MRTRTKSLTALLSAGVVVAALAGCAQSGTGDSTTSGAGSSASSTPSTAPSPAAVFTTVNGKTTDITLDAGFVAALKSLKLTPGTIGSPRFKTCSTTLSARPNGWWPTR